jgi:Fe-S-cluster containining protein
MGVQELKKPVNKWCNHCVTGRGCGIYGERPGTCREYECLWLNSQSQKGKELPAQFRPDKLGCVFSVGNDDVFTVHNNPPNWQAWKQQESLALIEVLLEAGARVIVNTSNPNTKIQCFRLKGGGIGHRTIEVTEADENGVQWFLPKKD